MVDAFDLWEGVGDAGLETSGEGFLERPERDTTLLILWSAALIGTLTTETAELGQLKESASVYEIRLFVNNGAEG